MKCLLSECAFLSRGFFLFPGFRMTADTDISFVLISCCFSWISVLYLLLGATDTNTGCLRKKKRNDCPSAANCSRADSLVRYFIVPVSGSVLFACCAKCCFNHKSSFVSIFPPSSVFFFLLLSLSCRSLLFPIALLKVNHQLVAYFT